MGQYMLNFLKYFAILLLIALCLVFAYFNIGRTLDGFDNFQLESMGTYKKHEHLEPRKTPTEGFPQIEEKLNIWWNQNNKNWKPTPTSYSKNFFIKTNKGSLNFLDDVVILNCCGGQYSKTLSKEEKDFIEKIKMSMSNLIGPYAE